MVQQARTYNTDADKVKVYGKRMAKAAGFHDADVKVIQDWVDRYENVSHVEQYTPKGHRTSVPTGTSVIDSLFSSLTAVDVDIIAEARGHGTADQEYLTSAALSQEWENCKVNQRAGLSIKDSLIVGIGWAKVAHEFYEEEQTVPRSDDAIAADIEAIFNSAREAGEPLPSTDMLMQVVEVEEVVPVKVKDRIVVRYVPWDRMRYDRSVKQLEDIRWYAEVQHLPVQEVRDNPLYQEYCKGAGTLRKLKALQGDSKVDTPFHVDGQETPDSYRNVDDDDMRITVYIIEDLETGTQCTLAKDQDFLLNEAPIPFALNDDLEDQTSYVPVVLRRTSSRVRGVSEMELMLPTLRELDVYHTRLATYIERFAPKVIVEKGAITQAGKRAMRSQEYGAVIEMETGRVSDVKPFEVPQLPAEIFGVPDKLEASIRESTGVNELMRGLFPDRRRTATETAEVVTASAARQAEKRLQLERFYGAIASRMLQLMQLFYDEERMVRYWDDEGPVDWTWNSDDIVYDTKLTIVLSPKEDHDRAAQREEGMAMLNLFGPLAATPDPATGVPLVDQRTLIRLVAEKMGIKRRDAIRLVKLPIEIQLEQQQKQQTDAAAAANAAGVVEPGLTSGPLNPAAVAGAVNSGPLPPEILAAAAGATPVSPGAVEQVSSSLGQPSVG